MAASYVNPMRAYAVTRAKDYPLAGRNTSSASEESRSFLHTEQGSGLIAKAGGVYRSPSSKGFESHYVIVNEHIKFQGSNLTERTGAVVLQKVVRAVSPIPHPSH